MGHLVRWIERVNDYIGRAMGWLMVALVLLVTGDVVSRYIFNTGAVVIQESEWWMFSIIFLMAAGYTFLSNAHVRVDIVYSLLSKKGQHIVDLSCAFIFLFPMCLLLILTSLWFIRDSWQVGEYSPDPGGLCCYYLLKMIIPIGFGFLALQGMADVYKKIQALKELASAPVAEDSIAARAGQPSETSS